MRSEPIDVRDRSPYSVEQLRVKPGYRDDLDRVLISNGEIESRIDRLSEEVTAAFADVEEGPVSALCVLNGAMPFFTSLVSRLELLVALNQGTISASRYAEGGPTGEEATIEWIDEELIAGRDVLVVEDIVDQGYTLRSIRSQLEDLGAETVRVAVLFDKRARRATSVELDFVGFVIPDAFVVGYGLDYAEGYRDLPHLAVLDAADVA